MCVYWPVCRSVTIASMQKNGWTNQDVVWVVDSFKESYTRWCAHRRQLVNTTEKFMCGGGAALCQIILTTCWVFVLYVNRQWSKITRENVITWSWVIVTTTRCQALTDRQLQAQNWSDEVPCPTELLSSLDTAPQRTSQAAAQAVRQHQDQDHREPSSHQHSSTVEQRLRWPFKHFTTAHYIDQTLLHLLTTRMWANAQPDGRPAEHRWRPLFNAAKFGWRPPLDAVQ